MNIGGSSPSPSPERKGFLKAVIASGKSSTEAPAVAATNGTPSTPNDKTADNNSAKKNSGAEAEVVVSLLRQHIQSQNKEIAQLKKRHSNEVSFLRSEIETLSSDIQRLNTIATMAGKSHIAKHREREQKRLDDEKANDQKMEKIMEMAAQQAAAVAATHAAAASKEQQEKEKERIVTNTEVQIQRVEVPAEPQILYREVPAPKPPMSDATTQCSSFVLKDGTEVGGISTSGSSSRRTSDIAALTAEADRVLSAIHTLREERTPMGTSVNGTTPFRRSKSGSRSALERSSSSKHHGETPPSRSTSNLTRENGNSSRREITLGGGGTSGSSRNVVISSTASVAKTTPSSGGAHAATSSPPPPPPPGVQDPSPSQIRYPTPPSSSSSSVGKPPISSSSGSGGKVVVIGGGETVGGKSRSPIRRVDPASETHLQGDFERSSPFLAGNTTGGEGSSPTSSGSPPLSVGRTSPPTTGPGKLPSFKNPESASGSSTLVASTAHPSSSTAAGRSGPTTTTNTAALAPPASSSTSLSSATTGSKYTAGASGSPASGAHTRSKSPVTSVQGLRKLGGAVAKPGTYGGQ